MTTTKDRTRWMLSALNDAEDLTQWEQEFIESVTERFEDGRELTDWQMEKLHEIYWERGQG